MSTDPAERLTSSLATAPTTTEVAGLGERPLAAPESLEEWTAATRLAREEGWKLLVTGFGSKLGWCPPPRQVDLVLSTRGFAGVTSYEPGDGTLSARAGTTMLELASTVAGGGHHLSPDVARPGEASLGGVLSASASGVDRLAYGPVRHSLLGTTVCLADGSQPKSGGQLVKNVTGYDLHRLYCGSHGTLCIVLEASLRLYPLPAAQAAVTRSFTTRDAALDVAQRVLDLPVHPRSVTVDQRSTEWRLVVALAGREDVVAWELDQLESVDAACEARHGEAARELLHTIRDLESDATEPALWLASTPSRMARNLARVERACADSRLRMLIHPGVATATIVFELAPEPAALARIETELRGGHVQARWRNLASPDASEELPGRALMRRLEHALDPEGVFSTGRFPSGVGS